jgi:hypothetical protein
MLRFKILASAVPLVVAGLLARLEISATAPACITLGATSVQLASAPGQAGFNVSFTDNPGLATVRVQIIDDAGAADFAYLDDADGIEANGCDATAATRLIGISATAAAAEPVIYLSQDGNADYRIFVRSTRFTPRQAAALIVGAWGGNAGTAAAAL